MGYLNNVVNIVDIRHAPRDHVESDIGELRQLADRQIAQSMLNDVLATQLVSVLRYRRYYFMVHELLVGGGMKRRFLGYAKTDQEHADRLAERIVQLGGTPHMDPSDLAVRSHSQFRAGKMLHDMIREDLLFVRTTIESYTDMMSYLKSLDPTTVRMLDWILAGQKERAEELTELLNILSATSPVPR
jgi:bacterioferritin